MYKVHKQNLEIYLFFLGGGIKSSAYIKLSLLIYISYTVSKGQMTISFFFVFPYKFKKIVDCQNKEKGRQVYLHGTLFV